ncbi:MAG: glycosyltransferase family 39 protein [Myxococcota bacterium]|nr:glycosyltransferase family 39 protein [Myxococcota bacterium]
MKPAPASLPLPPSGPPGPERPLDRVLLALALALGALLAFANLDAQLLWQDEAQSALLARTTLEHGIPLGTDGRNFFSQELGAEYDEAHRWRWHTWLHLYLVAGSFALFGESTSAARWPAALFGVLTLLVVYQLAREWWGRDRVAAHAANAVLLLLVPFWILVRQCRYYSLTAFLSTTLLLGYARIAGGRRGGGPIYLLAGVALFHAHYVYLAPLLVATAVHAALWGRGVLRPVLLSAGGVVALCAPWIVWQSGMDYGRHYADQLTEPSLWLANASWFVRSLLVHASGMVALAGLVLTAGLVGWRRGRGELVRLARDRGATAVALSAIALLATVSIVAPGPFFRYLTPLLPLTALALGALVAVVARWHALAALGLLAAIAASQPLTRFGYELTHGFDGPIEGLVTYLGEHADPTDVVWITYGDLPLKFYTNLRVLGGLTGEDLSTALQREPPDWVIVRRHVVHPDRDGVVADFIADQIDFSTLRKIELPFTDTPFENREEPAEHRFRSARHGAPVVLFRRARS